MVKYSHFLISTFKLAYFEIVSTSLGLIKLVFKKIEQSSKNRCQFLQKYLFTTKFKFLYRLTHDGGCFLYDNSLRHERVK